MKFRYTRAHIDFLHEGYQTMMIPELTEAFNERFVLDKSPGCIKGTLGNYKITCGRTTGMPKGYYKLVTPEQAEFIRQEYKRLPLPELTKAFNARFDTTLTKGQLRSFTHNHGFISGRTGCFEKGEKPWNAGTKGVMKPNSGNFKKGSIPPNLKPLGHERICTQDGYILMKVAERNPHTGAPTRYLAKHQVIWKAANGPIPEGHVIAFLDGDRLNCAPDNLRCVPRGVLQWMNKIGLNETTGEARKAAITAAQVMTAAKALERKRA